MSYNPIWYRSRDCSAPRLRCYPEAWIRNRMPQSLIPGILLLIIEILHHLLYQAPRNYGTMACMGSFRVHSMNKEPEPCPPMHAFADAAPALPSCPARTRPVHEVQRHLERSLHPKQKFCEALEGQWVVILGYFHYFPGKRSVWAGPDLIERQPHAREHKFHKLSSDDA